MDIVKAIIPAAGLGTRFLPYTKSVPKEMLPILTKPAIQLVVEEALASSLSNFLIITRSGKHTLSDFFDPAPQLEHLLKEHNKTDLISGVQRIIKAASFSYIHQPEPLGLGHALWLARHTVGKEYCAVLLPDDLIRGEQPGIQQLMRIARQEKASVVAVQEVPDSELHKYGVVGIKKQITPNLFQVSHLIEKPEQNKAPSNLAIVGRYILSHKIFGALEQLSSYATNELQLTDAITCMLHNNERVFAYKIQGTRHDVGNPLGWLQANLDYGLQDQLLGPALQDYCSQRGLAIPSARSVKNAHDLHRRGF